MQSNKLQPIEALPPGAGRESTLTVVWPSLCATPAGQWLGRCYQSRVGVRIGGVPLTVGWLAVALSAPLAAALYGLSKAPRLPLVVFGWTNPTCRRYRLTSRRILVEHLTESGAFASLLLEDFDTIRIDVAPGQQWFKAGDLVFLRGDAERLQLAGVPRPEVFRHTCLEAQQAVLGVRKLLAEGPLAQAPG